MTLDEIKARAKIVRPSTDPSDGAEILKLEPPVALHNRYSGQNVLVDKVSENPHPQRDTAHVQKGLWYDVGWFK
ncbi:MAG TPA: hypothetical protein VJI33_01780 [Candidatus Paceibacterota bacterium]